VGRATQVLPVVDRRGHRAFLDYPYRLYQGDRNWVAPLRQTERRRFDPRHNPSLAGRWLQRFVAWRDGRPVGRIAAIDDPRFAERWAPATGLFGFFESSDVEVTGRLLHAVEQALRARALRSCLGPVNLTTNDEVGLLVDGFESAPMLLTPHHPRRYQDELVANGYQARRDYHSYRWTPEARLAPSVERLTKWRLPPELRLRAFDEGAWDCDVRRLHAAYNECFDDLWGFVPMSWAEFESRARDFRVFYRPELVLLAERGPETVGFAVALPDANEALRGLNGRLLPWGWLRLWRRMGRLRTARALLVGVHPTYRGRGLAVRLAHEMHVRGRRLGLRQGELSLVQDENASMRRVVEAFGGAPIKTFRLYGKDLGASSCR
jgi:GNAT superfamily N-acetyltransferase